jgi:hypothetical protein
MWNGPCRMHGGPAGPRTAEGLRRSQRARWKHGACSGDTRRSHWVAPTMPHLTVAEEREYHRHQNDRNGRHERQRREATAARDQFPDFPVATTLSERNPDAAGQPCLRGREADRPLPGETAKPHFRLLRRLPSGPANHRNGQYLKSRVAYFSAAFFVFAHRFFCAAEILARASAESLNPGRRPPLLMPPVDTEAKVPAERPLTACWISATSLRRFVSRASS